VPVFVSITRGIVELSKCRHAGSDHVLGFGSFSQIRAETSYVASHYGSRIEAIVNHVVSCLEPEPARSLTEMGESEKNWRIGRLARLPMPTSNA